MARARTVPSYYWRLRLTGSRHQNYSGDFGDFASFSTHLRAIADEKGVDLLLV
jgi:hypothetical protein